MALLTGQKSQREKVDFICSGFHERENLELLKIKTFPFSKQLPDRKKSWCGGQFLK